MSTFIKFPAKYIIISLCILLSSCVRDVYEQIPEIPDKPDIGNKGDFDHSTVEEITLTVNADDQYNGEFDYQVEVYYSHPFYTKDAEPKYAGITNSKKPLTLKLVLPQVLKEIYVMQKDPTKGESVMTLPLENITTLSCDFRPGKTTETKAVSTKSTLKSDKYTRPSNAITLTDKNSEKLEANTSYYVPANTTVSVRNIKLKQNCSLYVEGTLDINANISWGDGGDQNATIIVSAGGKMQGDAGQVSSMSGDRYLKLFVANGADINLSKADLDDCDIENDGTISVDKITYKKGSARGNMLNNGLIKASSITLSERTLDNNGKILINGNLKAYGSTNSINNNCYIEAKSITIEDKNVNLGKSSMIKCETLDSKHCTFTLDSYSIFKVTLTSNFSADKTILTGNGNDRALVSLNKVTGAYDDILYFSKNLDVMMNDVKSSLFRCQEGAKNVNKNASVEIPAGECTGDGNLIEKPAPENPNYPIMIPNGGMYTFAMEDNWPSFGDYDMNDLVLGVKSDLITDKTGKITLRLQIQLRAVGGTRKLGAGIQFEKIGADKVHSVMYENSTLSVNDFFSPGGNGVESGNKAVLPLFDNAHHALRLEDNLLVVTNTYRYDKPVRTYYYDIEFMSSVSQSDLNIMALNFFIINGGDANQRNEVHLAGYAPTSKVKGESNNYISDEGMVWGIMIPDEFKYPKEGSPISSAYPDFTGWSQTAGNQSIDWYNNPSSSLIYSGNE